MSRGMAPGASSCNTSCAQGNRLHIRTVTEEPLICAPRHQIEKPPQSASGRVNCAIPRHGFTILDSAAHLRHSLSASAPGAHRRSLGKALPPLRLPPSRSGLLTGMMVIWDFVLTCTFLAACLVLHDRYFSWSCRGNGRVGADVPSPQAPKWRLLEKFFEGVFTPFMVRHGAKVPPPPAACVLDCLPAPSPWPCRPGSGSGLECCRFRARHDPSGRAVRPPSGPLHKGLDGPAHREATLIPPPTGTLPENAVHR